MRFRKALNSDIYILILFTSEFVDSIWFLLNMEGSKSHFCAALYSEFKLLVDVAQGPRQPAPLHWEAFAASGRWREVGAGGLPGHALPTWVPVGRQAGMRQSGDCAFVVCHLGPNDFFGLFLNYS